jgi:hypothetical protein
LEGSSESNGNEPTGDCTEQGYEECQEAELESEISEHVVSLSEGLGNLNRTATGDSDGNDLKVEATECCRVQRDSESARRDEPIKWSSW